MKVKLISLEDLYKHFITTKLILNELIMINIIIEQLKMIGPLFQGLVQFTATHPIVQEVLLD